MIARWTKFLRYGRDWLRRKLRPGIAKCVVVAADDRYYEFGKCALNTFLFHNPDWTPLIVDIGLTDDQRREIQACGITVRREPRSNHAKWAGGHARMRVLVDLLKSQAWDLIAILECDTVTFGPVDGAGDITRFLKSPRFYAVVAGENWGFVLFKPSLRSIRVFRDSTQTLHELENTFVMLEESSSLVAMWYHRQEPYRLQPATNCFIPWNASRFVEVSRRGIRLDDGSQAAVAHYSGDVLNHYLNKKGLDSRYIPAADVWHEYYEFAAQHGSFLFLKELPAFIEGR